MKSVLALGILAALAAATSSAQNVQITGFGQIVAGSSLDDNSPPLLGYDDNIDFRPESKFAIQIRGDLNEQWSATAQIIARGSEDFDPEFAWAYIGWNGGNGWSAKAGRQRIPFYRYSDFLEVGYAYAWVRPPRTVYGSTGFDNLDGINVAWNGQTGSFFHTAQFVYGSTDVTVVRPAVTFKQSLDSFWGLTWDTNYNDWLNLRAAYFTGDVSVDSPLLNPLLTALRGNSFNAAAAALDANADTGYFWGLGADVDWNNWVIGGELVSRRTRDSVSATSKEGYVSAGYRFGKWQPYVVHGWTDSATYPGIANLITGNTPTAIALRNGTLTAIARQRVEDTWNSVGARWDVATNVALKLDYTKYNNDLNTTPPNGDVLTVAATFTF